MFSAACAIFVSNSPFGAGVAPCAARSIATTASDCETEQMPQMRGAITSASSDGRPSENLLEAAIESCAETRASRTTPSTTSSATSRSPSTRLNGPTTMRLISSSRAPLPARVRCGPSVAFSLTRFGVADFDRAASATNQAFGMSSGRPTGMPATFGVCMKPVGGLEARRRAGDAGRAAARARAGAVPGALVAIADGLRRLAAEMLHQAAALEEMFGARFEFVKLVAAAAVMREMVGEELRPAEAVHVLAAEEAERERL